MHERVRASSKRDEQIKAQFKIRRARQLLAIIPLVPAMFVVGFSGKTGPGVTVDGVRLVPFAVVVIVAVLLVSFWNWRCPSCGGLIGELTSPKRCPKCGVELR